MILSKTRKIMKTGIAKYSKQLKLEKNETQILVRANEEDEGVNYMICAKWKPNMKVSFKDIMDTKIDLLGFENLASPFLRKSVDMYAKYYDESVSEMNLFIFQKDDKVGVAVYCGTKYKEMITLEKQFERLGI